MDFFTTIANFGLSTIFLWIAIIGGGIFLISSIFDGLFDFDFSIGGADVPGFQMFSVFLATGGAAGLISIGLGMTSAPAIIGIAAVLGVIIAGLFGFLMARLRKSANVEYKVDPSSIIGTSARVSWWNGTSGEVLVSVAGNTFKVDATSDEELVSPSNVKITGADFVGDKPVKVTVGRL